MNRLANHLAEGVSKAVGKYALRCHPMDYKRLLTYTHSAFLENISSNSNETTLGEDTVADNMKTESETSMEFLVIFFGLLIDKAHLLFSPQSTSPKQLIENYNNESALTADLLQDSKTHALTGYNRYLKTKESALATISALIMRVC